MSQQSPPDGIPNIGPQALGIVLGLFFGCLILYASRIYIHIVPTNRLGAPDYVVSLALILEIPVLVLVGISVSEGLGRYSYDIPPENKGLILRNLFIAGIIGTWVAYLARISVALMLIQLDISRLWRFLLYIAISVQVLIPLYLNIALLVQCRPLSTLWKPVSGAKCWTKEQGEISYYFAVGAAAASDITFAVMPAFLICSLKRPLLERAVIIVLMALGLFATGAVIARATVSATKSGDRMRKGVLQLVLCRLEDGLLIAAACAPFLKSPVGHCLHRKLGLPRFQNQDIELNSIRSTVH